MIRLAPSPLCVGWSEPDGVTLVLSPARKPYEQREYLLKLGQDIRRADLEREHRDAPVLGCWCDGCIAARTAHW